MKLREVQTRKKRLAMVEKELKLDLPAINLCSIDDENYIHCENYIGTIALPLGISGPFHIKGDYAKGTYYIPLATTEGALVASVNRGAKAFSKKQITTNVYKVGATRGPVLKTESIAHSKKVEEWIWEHMDLLAQETKKTSQHLNLSDVSVKRVGLYVYIRFSFDTDKAMGMNMATIATHHALHTISQKTHCAVIAVAGNYDSDKKPAWINSINGRGYIVQAEGIILRSDVQTILKTTPEQIYEVWKTKCLIGSALSGSMGFNAHHANIVAAFFAATGQDLAHVVEGSLGMTIVQLQKDRSLYVNVYLPALMLGTVGGGTNLKTQSEARSILKTGSPYVLAEVLGAAVLSGEISLLASLAEGSLASAHKTLGR